MDRKGQNMFSDLKELNLENNSRKKFGILTNIEINTVINNQ